MIEYSLRQGCEAVSAWPASLSPLGFSDPITGAESLAYQVLFCAVPRRGVSRHAKLFCTILYSSGLSHWRDLPVRYSVLSQGSKLVVCWGSALEKQVWLYPVWLALSSDPPSLGTLTCSPDMLPCSGPAVFNSTAPAVSTSECLAM